MATNTLFPDPPQKHKIILKASDLKDITNTIHDLLQQQERTSPFLLALDGRCAAGKTTLATLLAPQWDCNVIHTDDFYLPFCQRTASRLQQPGGHMNLERLRDEVLLPLRSGEMVTCRPYDCHDDKWLPAYPLDSNKPTIVEGSYSCHPLLAEFFDCKVFVDITPELQRTRLNHRSPETLDAFLIKWIPREECYFQTYEIRQHCDLVIECLMVDFI